MYTMYNIIKSHSVELIAIICLHSYWRHLHCMKQTLYFIEKFYCNNKQSTYNCSMTRTDVRIRILCMLFLSSLLIKYILDITQV